MSMDQSAFDQPPGEGTEPAPAAEGEQRPSRKAAWLAMGAVALALALVWLAPGISDTHVDEAAPAGEFPGEPEDAAATGKMAPLHFTLKDMNGVDVKLESFKGKVILINFWATWCGPCRVEIPDLVALQEQYRDDLVVLGLLVQDEFDENVPPFAAKYKMNYPVLNGNGREDVEEAYGPMWGLPTSVIVGRDGRIAKKHSGIASKEQFEREIKALL